MKASKQSRKNEIRKEERTVPSPIEVPSILFSLFPVADAGKQKPDH